jgi:secreted trypsin-like serine protease
MRLIEYIFLIALGLSAVQCFSFDLRDNQDVNIIGGEDAIPHEFPFIVSIRRSGVHICGGSIIHPEWIITSANCSNEIVTSLSVVAGAHKSSFNQGTEQIRNVSRVYPHPNFFKTLNDVALLRVAVPFDFNEFVQPITIPNEDFEPTATAIVAGWGAQTNGGSVAPNLKKAELLHDACNRTYENEFVNTTVCYRALLKAVCSGDIGGPLICSKAKTSESSGAYTLCGILSNARSCAQIGYPNLFTELSQFKSWVNTIVVLEDEVPVYRQTDTCGGEIHNSSGRIDFFSTSTTIPPHTLCTWVIFPPNDLVRFNLVSTVLRPGDHLSVSEWDTYYSYPTPGSIELSVNQSTTIRAPRKILIVQFSSNEEPHRFGFVLDFYTSGQKDTYPPLTTFKLLDGSTQSFSYPINGGNYSPSEKVIILVSPTTTDLTEIAFTNVDTQQSYDVVYVHSWNGTTFNREGYFSGTTEPPTYPAPQGLFAVSFQSNNDAVVGKGFKFTWY